MQKISLIELSGAKLVKQKSREEMALAYSIKERSAQFSQYIELIASLPLRKIDQKVKLGEDLTFEEAFCGMTYVLAATNGHFFNTYRELFSKAYGSEFTHQKAIACGTAFLQLMAMKESTRGIFAAEIAGIAAASLIDLVVRFESAALVETCGMGGDKGFLVNGTSYKSINASTLSSLVIAGVGIPAIKHGSYSNTSAVGSTEAIELLGAKIDDSSISHIEEVWRRAGYYYFDAHWCKTIHDLSHLLMMETINHVAGPMSVPVSASTPLSKLMGVNEKVEPMEIAKAYNILHRHGFQKMDGVAIIGGIDQTVALSINGDGQQYRKHIAVDEFSPFGTIVALGYRDRFLGTFLLTPEDFGVSLDYRDILIPNQKDRIHKANLAAISGSNSALADYLALNAALGIFCYRYLYTDDAIIDGAVNRQYLRLSYQEARAGIESGKAQAVLENFVGLTGGLTVRL